jgi:uncharacterized membrane protein YhhN
MSIKQLDAAFFVLALAFVGSLLFTPYNGDFLLKVLPIICLLLMVVKQHSCYRQRLIIAALVFCGIGDISLEFDRFTLGLSAFLIGHLFYAVVFWHKLRLTLLGGAMLLGIFLYGALVINWLNPYLGEMQLPVYMYLLVIITMAVSAIAGNINHRLVALGALLFVLSDSLIAINRFIEPVPGARYWIMVLYYAAQYLLTYDARRDLYKEY